MQGYSLLESSQTLKRYQHGRGWVFPTERNTFDGACCPPGMIRGVIIKLPRMHDGIGKWSIMEYKYIC